MTDEDIDIFTRIGGTGIPIQMFREHVFKKKVRSEFISTL